MFKNILLPTDGSKLSEKSVKNGIALAKQLGAKITAMHVVPKFHTFTYQTEMLEATREEFLRAGQQHAEEFLRYIKKLATAAGVACDTVSATGDHPYKHIIKTAEKKGCDLILMASHGRRGVEGFLLGSETQKVLTHSAIPVLVYR